MTKPVLREEDQRQSDAGFRRERAALISAFLHDKSQDGEKVRQWYEDLLAVDCLGDNSHHIPNWRATYATPVIRFQMSWGGPGDQWELAVSRRGRRFKLEAAAYVFLPWWAYDAHHIRQGSEAWDALVTLLSDYEDIAGDDIFDVYSEDYEDD